MAEQTNTQGSQQRSGNKSNGKWQGGKKGSQQNENENEGSQDQFSMGSAREALDNVTEKASDYVDKATEYFGSFNVNPSGFIRDYPVQAAIGGLVVGFILGTAVSRRSIG